LLKINYTAIKGQQHGMKYLESARNITEEIQSFPSIAFLFLTLRVARC